MSILAQGPEEGGSTRRWGRRGFGCLTIIIVLLAAYYGIYLILRVQAETTPQLIAHRGGPVYNPENTMTAFQYAIEVGANWLEFDVQRTMDDILVVIHDETVDRTTNGSGLVGQFT